MKSYVATPTIDYPKDKVLIYVPDIFGVQLVNHQVRRSVLRHLKLPRCTAILTRARQTNSLFRMRSSLQTTTRATASRLSFLTSSRMRRRGTRSNRA